MAIEFKVKVYQSITDDTGIFTAMSEDAGGGDVIFVGKGYDPYLALHDLINKFKEAELYRPD
ncbi:MAG: hypothetical protein WC373_11075 [Smithella sp.]|jgi:hypothetical protein